MKCRHCAAELELTFLDLGSAPPSNAYLSPAALRAPETWYPLRLLTCTQCWLVQTEDHAGREALFTDDYAYFSSFSTSWLAHSQSYVEAMQQRWSLNANSLVVEVASNDGYLLQYVQARGIPCFGIEPTASTAAAARAKGLEVIEKFFGVELAQQLRDQDRQTDLMAANNVLAHVPDINDFVGGFATLLKPHGVATFEFPHLLRLVREHQFDTVYHEHYSYLSLTAVKQIFSRNGLQVFDVQEIPTHGGSLRVFAQRDDVRAHTPQPAVAHLLEIEQRAGINRADFYQDFQPLANKVKNDLMAFLIEEQLKGQRVAAYGAAAKGNTLLNYAGVRDDLISFVVDSNPAKQNKYLPGCRIPIVDEARLKQDKPDWVVILPWNLKSEIIEQLSYIRSWGAKFIVAVPELQVIA